MNPTHTCRIGAVEIGAGRLALIAGPCMAENLDLCLTVARHLRDICQRLDVGYIFKAGFDKANRSSLDTFRGPGLTDGLAWLGTVAQELGVPVLTDVHDTSQVSSVAEVADCLQIPAFLCRQTDLLVAAARTGRAVNIKKGQFMSPRDMGNAVTKVRSCNNNVLLTERGTFFGYNRLVCDIRSIPQMQEFAPVVFDATHSVQQPGGLGIASGGEREYAPLLGAAALAARADALFMETHTQPEKALSDAASQIPLEQMATILTRCLGIFHAARKDD